MPLAAQPAHPGNNPGGGVGGYSVNGASGSENAFVIDGVEVSNIRNAALGRESAIPFEFVREVQVKSGGFEAEYGGATGGVVNVITKSGSDEFHGQGSLSFHQFLVELVATRVLAETRHGSIQGGVL